MRFPIQRRLAVGFSLALLALVVARLLAYRSATGRSDSEHWVAHTQETLAALASTLSAVQEAESGQRGFLITGSKHYLHLSYAARNTADQRIAILKGLTQDNAQQQATLGELHAAVRRRFQVLDGTLHEYDKGGFEAAARVIRTDRGGAAMRTVRNLIDRLEADEQRLLQSRSDAAQATARRGNLVFAAVSALELLLLVLAAWQIERSIRQRDRAAAALRAAQQRANDDLRFRMAAIVESSEDAIISKTLDGVVTTWNAAAERIFGYRAIEAIGRPMSFIIPPERQLEEIGILDRLRHGDRVEPFETVRLTRVGERIDASVAVAPIRDADGRVVGASNIARDVTARKRVEQALRVSEARIAGIVSAYTNAVITIDARGTIDFVNPATLSMFGYTEAELLGQNVKVLMPHPHAVAHDNYLQNYHRTGERRVIGMDREIEAQRKDGTTFPIELSVSEIPPDGPGGARRFAGVIRDITSRKRTEARILQLNADLRRKVAELETLFAVAPIGVSVAMDPECHEIRANPALSEMLGFPSGANVTKTPANGQAAAPFKVLQAGRELSPDQLPMQRAARQGEAVTNVPFELVRADGQVTPIIGNAAPLFDEVGIPRGAIGVFWDVTELRRADELRVAKEAAEAANRAKDDFLATISHDLRTPLGAILLSAECLRRDRLAPAQRRLVDEIEECAHAQSRLIEDILDATRILHGKLRVDLRPLELRAVVRAAVGAVAATARQRGIQILVDHDGDRRGHNGDGHNGAGHNGDGRDDPRVMGDSLRLQQVCWNLLTNALKFSRRGSTIRVRTGHDDSSVWARVIDQGKGIDADFLPHVFDRLAQSAGATTRRHSGLGLGLSIVRHIAELHGGQVTAESEGPGRGATFTVTLPRAPVAEDGLGRHGKNGQTAGGLEQVPSLGGVRVLVVGPGEEPRESLALVFGLCGAQVQSAASVDAAWATCQEWRPHVVVTEEPAIGTDGLTLPRKICGLAAGAGQTPIVALLESLPAEVDLDGGYDLVLPRLADPGEVMAAVTRLAARATRGAQVVEESRDT